MEELGQVAPPCSAVQCMRRLHVEQPALPLPSHRPFCLKKPRQGPGKKTRTPSPRLCCSCRLLRGPQESHSFRRLHSQVPPHCSRVSPNLIGRPMGVIPTARYSLLLVIGRACLSARGQLSCVIAPLLFATRQTGVLLERWTLPLPRVAAVLGRALDRYLGRAPAGAQVPGRAAGTHPPSYLPC